MRDIEFRDVRKLKETGEIVFDYYTLKELHGEDSWQGSVNYTFITTQQFSGLKDKNGKKIFEGDILNLRGRYRPQDREEEEFFPKSGKVIWDDENGMWWIDGFEEIASCMMAHWQSPDWCRLEIIGNIHSNPELLEEI